MSNIKNEFGINWPTGFSLTDGGMSTLIQSSISAIDSSLFAKHKIIPEIEQVIFQKEHTIVVWKDKTRTIVRCCEEDFDKEKGLAMAICKKIMDRNQFKRLIDNAAIQDK